MININDALNTRHGIMVVGEPISGKTASIKLIFEVLNTLHNEEFDEKYEFFMRTKARNLSIPIKVVRGEIFPKSTDPTLESILRMTPEEKQMLIDACRYKGA